MIAQLVFGLLLACSLLGQTRVELTKQVKGALPPDKGGTGVSSCLENEGLVWQSGEFACSALASGPHAPTHQHGGTDEVATAIPADDAIPKAGGTGTLAEGWIPASISQDMTWTGAHDFKQINGVLVSTSFDWFQSPGGTLAIGPNTVTLAPCPSGVSGTNTNHYLYISGGAGTAEAVLITGGTCTSNAPSGTIAFSAANSHSGAWQIGSATAGIQEAVWAVLDTPQNGGKIFIPAGTHDLFQALSVGNGTATISAQGTDATIQFVRLIGAGTGEGQQNDAAPYATQLRWLGPAASTMITFRGPMEGSGLENMKITGMNTITGTLLELFFAFGGHFENIYVGRGGAGSVAIKLHAGSNDNYWERILIGNNSRLGTSGLFLGDNADPSFFGISQNVFNDVSINFIANEPTSVGLEIEGADNNTFIQLNVFGGIYSVTDCTNATPIVVTTSANHNRTTGDFLRITGAVGNTACNGFFNITVLTATTFELDGSVGNGTWTSGGGLWGPGHAVRFDQVGSTGQPASNIFINPAFQRGLFTSLGNHSDQWFFPMSTGDGTIPAANTSTGRSEFNGFARAMLDSAQGTVDNFGVLMGKLKFVADDNITGFAKFYPATSKVAVGDVDDLSDPNGQFEVRRDGADAKLSVTNLTSGDALIEIGSNKAYQLRVDRTNDDFRIGTAGTPRLLFMRDAATDRVGAGAAFIHFSVTQVNLPAVENGALVYCSDCTRGSVACTAGGSGSMAKREAGLWNCD